MGSWGLEHNRVATEPRLAPSAVLRSGASGVALQSVEWLRYLLATSHDENPINDEENA